MPDRASRYRLPGMGISTVKTSVLRTRCFRGIEKVAHEGAISNDIELKPELRVAGRRGNLGEGANRYCRETERDPRAFCRVRRLDLAPSSKHTGNTDRPQHHGKRELASKERGCKIHIPDASQHSLSKRDLGKIRNVSPQRELGVGPAIGVVK